MYSQKYFLRDFFRFRGEPWAEDGHGQTKHRLAIAEDQFREGFLITALVAAGNELLVGVHKMQGVRFSAPDER